MKKFFFFIVAVLLANACNKNQINTDRPTESEVTFMLTTPEIVTKAFGDGTIANDLYYGVYDAEGNLISEISKISEPEEIKIQKTISLRLVTGNTYSMIFWAENEAGVCTVDFETKEMSFSPESANFEGYDAFYAYVEPFKVQGDMSKTISLYRPFAQVNVGTNDRVAASEAGLDITTSQIVVTTPSVLNLVDGSVSEEVEFTYSYAAMPEGEEFPVKGYDYLSMNYLLVSAEKMTVDIQFSYNGGGNYVHNFTFVPVQRNYRTNIYGSILTSGVGINIVIEPAFKEPDYHYPWIPNN